MSSILDDIRDAMRVPTSRLSSSKDMDPWQRFEFYGDGIQKTEAPDNCCNCVWPEIAPRYALESYSDPVHIPGLYSLDAVHETVPRFEIIENDRVLREDGSWKMVDDGEKLCCMRCQKDIRCADCWKVGKLKPNAAFDFLRGDFICPDHETRHQRSLENFRRMQRDQEQIWQERMMMRSIRTRRPVYDYQESPPFIAPPPPKKDYKPTWKIEIDPAGDKKDETVAYVPKKNSY